MTDDATKLGQDPVPDGDNSQAGSEAKNFEAMYYGEIKNSKNQRAAKQAAEKQALDLGNELSKLKEEKDLAGKSEVDKWKHKFDNLLSEHDGLKQTMTKKDEQVQTTQVRNSLMGLIGAKVFDANDTIAAIEKAYTFTMNEHQQLTAEGSNGIPVLGKEAVDQFLKDRPWSVKATAPTGGGSVGGDINPVAGNTDRQYFIKNAMNLTEQDMQRLYALGDTKLQSEVLALRK